MLSLKTGIHPKPGPQTHICVCDICLKLITKHQISILCKYKKHWMHLKRFQNYNKRLPQLKGYTLHSTFNHRTQTNITSPKSFLKVLQLNANGICNKTDKIQLLIKNTQADVITIQESKLNQSHKTPNLSYFTPIRTDCTNKHEESLLTYIKNSISFLQLYR